MLTRDAADVNGDGDVTALDVLVLINAINQQTDGFVSVADLSDGSYDVNGDHILSALDALIVINRVNAAAVSGAVLAEGEAAGLTLARSDRTSTARSRRGPGRSAGGGGDAGRRVVVRRQTRSWWEASLSKRRNASLAAGESADLDDQLALTVDEALDSLLGDL